jgi:hypothetical protein
VRRKIKSCTEKSPIAPRRYSESSSRRDPMVRPHQSGLILMHQNSINAGFFVSEDFENPGITSDPFTLFITKAREDCFVRKALVFVNVDVQSFRWRGDIIASGPAAFAGRLARCCDRLTFSSELKGIVRVIDRFGMMANVRKLPLMSHFIRNVFSMILGEFCSIKSNIA